MWVFKKEFAVSWTVQTQISGNLNWTITLCRGCGDGGDRWNFKLCIFITEALRNSTGPAGEIMIILMLNAQHTTENSSHSAGGEQANQHSQ